jgi:hypothetical protein
LVFQPGKISALSLVPKGDRGTPLIGGPVFPLTHADTKGIELSEVRFWTCGGLVRI